ncbi:MAG TPA: 16S rRNA (cytidine(1402)-2'-O)-methyltransferase [Bacteroidales bacterium]|nr:16S rRNA (cytidine(1402)-2'-O)-methyltransferase [Bacteroidales bacterium]HOW41898.1 16S rRNA (cytidine(1402)-2'-O)-methyltransferase [Bacteroidales bacterium]HOX73218.1 16S rRNA (cytidine(1402)-2'-O)-methyltransferase [Bacteroidales bacterium]HPM86449.1 16S rRNA (cytidine(1402)-2'-O)-methyltransferase [Bacteroidales bacterium]HQM68172.1 16S rRNA (cytidine(1402)-2'-O)-methyltransferase [Bacteroidales bacterium]
MSKLFLIPTPVGNLKDITFRAVEILGTADIILAEDTRHAGMLLKHYNIRSKMIPHHKFNEHKAVESVCSIIESGKTAALISDAGTPGISDPGFLLVRKCIERGIEVETLPGATALIPALVNSGLPSDRFCFEGFLPVKKGRQKRLTSLENETRTMIFYESPFRLLKTLAEMAAHFGPDRPASVSRELTKIFEENIRGTLASLSDHYEQKPPKGEIVLVVAGKDE